MRNHVYFLTLNAIQNFVLTFASNYSLDFQEKQPLLIPLLNEWNRFATFLLDFVNTAPNLIDFFFTSMSGKGRKKRSAVIREYGEDNDNVTLLIDLSLSNIVGNWKVRKVLIRP